jgi:membrane protein
MAGTRPPFYRFFDWMEFCREQPLVLAGLGLAVGAVSVRGTRRIPLWVTAATIALLALGFSRSRIGHASMPVGAQRPGSIVAQGDRGRSATAPSEMPPRGWKDILLRIWKNIGRDRVIVVAAGVTFYSILAVFPAIAALVALYGLFADPATITSHLDSIVGVMPGGAIEVIRDQIMRVASQGRTTLGLTFVVSLLVSLWSANAGMKSLFDALNLVYNETEERGFFKLNLVSLTFTLLAILFVLVAIGAMVVVPIVLDFLGLGAATEVLVKIARWPALLIVVALALAVLYRYGPSREKAQWRWITWGSVAAAIAWLVVSILFSWYAENFGSYNKTYGSLGAIIGFMFWLWLSIIVVLIGGELNAEAEHQTVRDTTIGGPKPMGHRGATMADTLGAKQE